MSAKVDVLAVMDAEITDLSQICDAEEVREYCFRQREAVLREARAAVAELIDAAKLATEEKYHDGASSREACDRLVAALANIGPQS